MTGNGFPLRDRCALITGGARRIGAAVVQALHAAGANVVIHSHRSHDDAAGLARKLDGARIGSVSTVSGDLRQAAVAGEVVDHALRKFGRLDVLVNNASTFYPTPLGSIDEWQFDDLIGTNLKAPLFVSQRAAPALREAGGLIVNMADIHARRPLRDHAVYCCAKAGLLMLTRSLARELAPEVRVNGIAPGSVLWPEAGLAEDQKAEILRRTPLGRCGSPEDIARCVLFFACDAPFVTGQIIAVDGGRSIAW